jgi:signal peptidase II
MFFIILACILLLDQATKYLAYIYLQPQSTIPVINKIFYLTYLENKGAAFGILQNSLWFLIVVTLIIVIISGIYIYRTPRINIISKYSIALIIAGALGNLIDRIIKGYVIDFFDFVIWPVFNIADMSVVIGAFILIFILLFDKRKIKY